MKLSTISRRLSDAVETLSFAEPVTHVYNPLRYAWKPHKQYVETYGGSPKEVLLLGMNPGPFGMAQTGVPFGDVSLVRDWIGIEEKVDKPEIEHPKRLVEGFNCPRSEVSGTRLWSWAKKRFSSPQQFFARFFVWNYCPLSFMAESGKNLTPDKLPKEERDALFEICDKALEQVISTLKPKSAIGIGGFALKRIKAVGVDEGTQVGTILHPSPASPAANKGGEEKVEQQFKELEISI